MDAGQAQSGPRFVAAGSISGRKRTILTSLPLGSIRPNPDQPRRHFDAEALRELADSIRERGLLHPIIVQKDGNAYRIVAGERRYRAAREAGLEHLPALVRDDDPLEIAMIENLQREDLTALETAHAMARLVEDRGYTHAELAALVHKSRPYVSNTLALLRLPEEIQREYHDAPTVPRDILISVARQKDPEAMESLWKRVKLEDLSVRQFRETTSPDADPGLDIRRTISTARRLGRRLESLPADVDGRLRLPLERTLRRLRKKIDAFLATPTDS